MVGSGYGAEPGLSPPGPAGPGSGQALLEGRLAAFAAQQAAEKAVKAVFQRMGALAWGRSVAGLLEGLAQSFPVPEALLDAASELDKAYIPSRYPDALPEGAPFERYRRPEAERLLAHAEAVYAFCESLLSQMD